MKQRRTTDSDSPEPYDEPQPDADEWPDDWTPKQKENWRQHGQPVYEKLETNAGRYWYRRTWRPKKQRNGMMQRDHVKLGTPEDYVAEHVSDTLNPMGNMTSVMMRKIGRMNADTDDLDEAYEDIVQAKIKCMSPARQARLGRDAARMARAYGLDLPGDADD